jgi:hypothetical protein
MSAAVPGTRSRSDMASRPWAATAGLLVLLALGGCASTRFANTWKDPAYQGGPLRRVAIFVVHPDQGIRRLAEDEAVRRLPRGTQGSSGYRLASPSEEQNPETVMSRLRAAGFDGAIVSRLAGVDRTQTWVPPTVALTPAPVWTFPGYYGYAYQQVYSPGYLQQDTIVRVETNVYALDVNRLVWAGTSQTFNPDSTRDVIEEVVGATVKELEKDKLLAER